MEMTAEERWHKNYETVVPQALTAMLLGGDWVAVLEKGWWANSEVSSEAFFGFRKILREYLEPAAERRTRGVRNEDTDRSLREAREFLAQRCKYTTEQAEALITLVLEIGRRFTLACALLGLSK